MTRRSWIDPTDEPSVVRQCQLVGASRAAGGSTKSGLEHRYHLRSAAAWLRLSGGDHRLVQPKGAQLAVEQQHGCGLLR